MWMEMDLDEEEPPNLVDVGRSYAEAPNPMTAQMQDLTLAKVPLTIVTEFGDSADIEKALTVSKNGQETQEWLELGNGCLCCSIKDSGVNAIESLMDRRGSFDYIMLETSGLADPGNLAPLFWVDEGLGSSIYLDGIVTLVDAKNILLSLDETPIEIEEHEGGRRGPHLTTAHLQISHADVILINKCDSVSSQQLARVETRISSINGLAKVHRTQYSRVPNLESFLLDLHAYDGVDSLDSASSAAHSHLDPTISTISLRIPNLKSAQLPALESWLRQLVWEHGIPTIPTSCLDSSFPQPTDKPDAPNTIAYLEHCHSSIDHGTASDIRQRLTPNGGRIEIHRTKGRFWTADGQELMLQGVREVYEIVDMGARDIRHSAEVESRTRNAAVDGSFGPGKLVIIGRGLHKEALETSLKWALDGS